MKIVDFPEVTSMYAKNQPQYITLPAHAFHGDPQGRIACCWKLTWRERFIVLFSGVVWHQILTFGKPLQPQKLTVEKPEMHSPDATTSKMEPQS